MSTFIGSSINDSATIVLPAGADLKAARAIALAVEDGAVVLPAAGANVIGISLVETDEAVATGDDVDIQIKDIGKWVAGKEIAVGDELATDASGHAVVATSGAFIVGVALSSAAEAGTWVQVQISKSGYKA